MVGPAASITGNQVKALSRRLSICPAKSFTAMRSMRDLCRARSQMLQTRSFAWSSTPQPGAVEGKADFRAVDLASLKQSVRGR